MTGMGVRLALFAAAGVLLAACALPVVSNGDDVSDPPIPSPTPTRHIGG